uniref:Ribosomal protein L34 n=1 Tax=Gronococcus sybilensis TaxID=3028029 RepID=A0A9Y1MWZ2_9RHOD|nr:ribosomal protein L34 [Gronococcus sybilensis]
MTKRTLEGTRRNKIRTSGFRSRMKASSGYKILKARRHKNRRKISKSN